MNRANHTTSGWTDERVATLKKLWAEGKSASEIARTLNAGFSRNSVIGKVHRLGIQRTVSAETRRLLGRVASPRPAPVRPPRETVRQVETVKAAPKAETARPVLVVVACEPVPFHALEAGRCKWPVSLTLEEEATAETLFCSAPAETDDEGACRSYCAAHRKLGTQQPKPGEKKRSVKELTRSLRRFCAA